MSSREALMTRRYLLMSIHEALMTGRYLLMSSREALNLRHVSRGNGGTDLLNFVK
jgi:hypothetical protein